MNKKLRAATVTRAEGKCEACGRDGVDDLLHYDHFHGRRHGERLESGWMLCLRCDDDKTNNRPSAAHWLGVFIAHLNRHGYPTERAEAVLAVKLQKFPQEKHP